MEHKYKLNNPKDITSDPDYKSCGLWDCWLYYL